MNGWKFVAVGRAGSGMIRVLHASCRVTAEGDRNWRSFEDAGNPWIANIWHGTMLTPIWRHRDRDVIALVSEHRDGEYITRVLERLGYGTARGSSTRGGVRALRELLRAGRSGRVLAVTPDGPRGPIEVMKTGALVLAGRSGIPLVPIGVGMSRAWRLSSWDRFSIPKPFSHVHIRYGDPIHVPADLDASGMEELRMRVQMVMDDLTASARRTAGDRLERDPAVSGDSGGGVGEEDDHSGGDPGAPDDAGERGRPGGGGGA